MSFKVGDIVLTQTEDEWSGYICVIARITKIKDTTDYWCEPLWPLRTFNTITSGRDQAFSKEELIKYA